MITKNIKTPKIDFRYLVEIETDEGNEPTDSYDPFDRDDFSGDNFVDLNRNKKIFSADVTSFDKTVISDHIRSEFLKSIRNQVRFEKAQAVKKAKAEAKANNEVYVPLPKTKLPDFSALDVYGIDRIVMSSNISNDSFEVDICSGYYGEELGSVELDSQIEKDIFKKIKKYLNTKSLTKRIELLLEWEGKSIPSGVASIQEVNFQKIETVEINLEKEFVIEYQDRDLGDDVPIGILVKENDKYCLFDGKYRLAAAKQDEETKASFIVIS